jgi:outer membrane autotransporter protein
VATEKTPLLLGVRGAVVRDFEQDNDIQVGGITAEQRLGGTSWAELGVNVSYNLSETTLLTANVSGQLGSKRHGKGVSVGYLWTF